jgi:acyl-CoA thioesterase FadM
MSSYQITQEIRIHHEDGWFYQFTEDGEGQVEITAYTTHGVEERKSGEPFYIPKDCIDTFIRVLEQLK